MLKQKTCPYCGRIFFYDKIDAPEDRAFGQEQLVRSSCPTCVDPNAVAMMTYHKTTMLSGYRQYLRNEELVELLLLDDETTRDMMFDQFPLARQTWEGTTFRTFTIFPETAIQRNEFTIGIAIQKVVPKKAIEVVRRQIICNRCQKKTWCSKFHAMSYYFGFLDKICFLCDNHKIRRVGPGYFSVRHVGGVPRDDSLRAKAKALNVSVNDLRKGITQSEPVLALGTSVNGLEIVGTYFDERKNHYYPCYLLLCKKCGNRFGIEQKKVETLFHKC